MTIEPDFSQSYPPAEAERGKFVTANTTDPIFDDLPVDSRGKYTVLTMDVTTLGAGDVVDFSQSYSTAEAERGKFVKLDPSTITGLPSSTRGKYAMLTYPVNSQFVGGSAQSDLDMGGYDINNVGNLPSSDSFSLSASSTELVINKEAFDRMYHFSVYMNNGSDSFRSEDVNTAVYGASSTSLYTSTPSIGDTSDVTISSFVSSGNIMVTVDNVGSDTWDLTVKDWK